MRRQQLFSKIFAIVCNMLSRNKMQTHFLLVFLLSTPFPHPAEAVSEPKRTTYIPMTIWPPIMHRFFTIFPFLQCDN